MDNLRNLIVTAITMLKMFSQQKCCSGIIFEYFWIKTFMEINVINTLKTKKNYLDIFSYSAKKIFMIFHFLLPH